VPFLLDTTTNTNVVIVAGDNHERIRLSGWPGRVKRRDQVLAIVPNKATEVPRFYYYGLNRTDTRGYPILTVDLRLSDRAHEADPMPSRVPLLSRRNALRFYIRLNVFWRHQPDLMLLVGDVPHSIPPLL
jgi:hypothetical protein